MKRYQISRNGKNIIIDIGKNTLTKNGKTIAIKDYDNSLPIEEIIMAVLVDKDRYDITYGLKAFCEASDYGIDDIHAAVADFEYCERISQGIDRLFTKEELNILYDVIFYEEELELAM